MEKNQMTKPVADSMVLPLRQSEDELRCGSDRASAISTDVGVKPTPLANVNTVAGAIKNKAESSSAIGSCKQNLWFSFFFDGTGNNSDADSISLKHSNVARLFNVHKENDRDLGIYKFYIPGVGTYFEDISDRGGSTLGGSSGDLGDRRLTWAFKRFNLALAYHVGLANSTANAISEINISAFGFSRGSALARAFIYRLINKECKKNKDGIWCLKKGGYKIRIRFMGIFDTVASVGLAMSANTTSSTGTIFKDVKMIIKRRTSQYGGTAKRLAYGFKSERDKGLGADPSPGFFNGHGAWGDDLIIPDMVEEVRHFIAAHELRNSFPVDSVSLLSSSGIVKAPHFFETVYPGVHSDVGGSYRPGEGGKSNISINKLGLIPLIDMYRYALKKGVPFLPVDDWQQVNKDDFRIGNKLLSVYSHYMGKIQKSSILGDVMNSHMALYYAWRFRSIHRKEKGDRAESAMIEKNDTIFNGDKKSLEKEISILEAKNTLAKKGITEITQNMYAISISNSSSLATPVETEKLKLKLVEAKKSQKIAQDKLYRAEARLYSVPPTGELNKMIDMYDAQLIDDAKDIYSIYGKALIGRAEPDPSFRKNLRPHYKVLMDAYENEYIHGKGLQDEIIIDFFDNFVHDSLAGFAKDATLPSDPRVIYLGGDNKYQYANLSIESDRNFSNKNMRIA